MVELTQRERAIVHTMNFMMNPQTKAVPLDTRATALKVMIGIQGINATVEFCQELTHAVADEMDQAQGRGFKFLDAHKDMLKDVDFAKALKGDGS